MKTLRVNLGENSYDILIGSNTLSTIGDFVESKGGKVFILSDTNVAPIFANTVMDNLLEKGYDCKLMVLPAGEPTKSITSITPIYSSMIEFKLTRRDLIITLGGGVVGDLGGFVASTYLRGVDFVQVPTSLLAQVDSSVGGKVAVDLPEGKNLVGSFYQPKLVFIDVAALEDLPEKYFIDGMAEVIKYGCIKDEKLFELLESIKSRSEFMQKAEEIIYTCCDIKRRVVEVDEKDNGERMLLNFGHTYGHAIEKHYNFVGYSHGQAVAIGMAFISKISEKLGQCEKGTTQRIVKILTQYGLPCEDKVQPQDVLSAILNDKKNLGKKLHVVLLKKIGESFTYATDAKYFLN
ncbi:MAG: 3-dehydroquinate synthase [Clostridia bacterium]|nr:3-dehydroquinate synthase [Clostridia bacterium]MDE7328373.1 3-dehydroquinate synthase [Clostridia bacterium]